MMQVGVADLRAGGGMSAECVHWVSLEGGPRTLGRGRWSLQGRPRWTKQYNYFVLFVLFPEKLYFHSIRGDIQIVDY